MSLLEPITSDQPDTDPEVSAELASQFWNLVDQSANIVITSHINPDGDAVGTLLALYHTLLAHGKDPIMVCHDPAPDHLKFLPGADLIFSAGDVPERCRAADLLIIVDCSHPSRLGDALACVRGATNVAVLDHHGDAHTLEALHMVDVHASSAGEIVFRLLRRLGVPLTPEAALCLYVAILTDTGSFRYGNTSATAFGIASELLKTGSIDVHSIGIHIFARDTLSRLRLRGMVFEQVQLEDAIIHSVITPTMIATSGSNQTEAEGLIDDLALCRDAEVAAMFWEMPDGTMRIQLRSIKEASVLPIARAIGGGGHQRAAGGRLKGVSLVDARSRILAAARTELGFVDQGGIADARLPG